MAGSGSNSNRLAISDKPEVGIVVALKGRVAHPNQARAPGAASVFLRTVEAGFHAPSTSAETPDSAIQFLDKSDKFRSIGPEVECRAEAFEQPSRFPLPLWIAVLHPGRDKHLIEAVAPGSGIWNSRERARPLCGSSTEDRIARQSHRRAVEALDERDQMKPLDLFRKHAA